LEVKDFWYDNLLVAFGIPGNEACRGAPFYQQTCFIYSGKLSRIFVMMPGHVCLAGSHPKKVDNVSIRDWNDFDIIQVRHKRDALHKVAEIQMAVNATHGISDLVNLQVA